MVLGIDASRFGHEYSTGVEWYSYYLLNELVPMLGRDHNMKVRLYSPREFNLGADMPLNVTKRIIPAKRFWTVVRLSIELVMNPVDMLFVPSHTFPMVLPKKSIITIHDVAFRHFKECYSKLEYLMLDRSTKKAVRKAWKIIVPSEATKLDLINIYNCDEKKIVVIPHGAPEFPKLINWREEEKERFLKQFHLNDKDLFIFYVGRLEAKKNLSRLVEGFSRFVKEFPDWKLVMAGKRGTGFEDILEKVKELGVEKQVIMPGYVTEKEKLFLFSSCRILAFPSLYEGFGLPVLEGFAIRRPVLTSNRSSIPEVAGKGAFLVNPEKVEEISVGLKRLAADGFLVNQLISQGDQQLSKFSWEKAAQQTYDAMLD